MQERYVVDREERFKLIIKLVKTTQPKPKRLLDLGCGTGTLTLRLVEAFPNTEIIGIDYDPTLIPLAQKRCQRYSNRVRFIQEDLRLRNWITHVKGKCDAVVSATALHWLSEKQLVRLYNQLVKLLKSGGIFLNADHAGNSYPPLQQYWESHRNQMKKSKPLRGEGWGSFWKDYLKVLGSNSRSTRRTVLGPWEGIEKGLPLSWHLDTLRQAGFIAFDCFWRCDCDAIYGGIKGRR